MTGRRIGIVGSGQAGLLAAHGLVQAGHEVTLYSDRTADQWLRESKPTGAAARFELALAYERELGLAHWEDVAPRGRGVHLTFCPKVGNRLVTMAGSGPTYFQAIDLRLQSHRWMNDLEAAGGKIVVGKIDPARLDAIAPQHELVLVATGRGPLAELFPRNAVRSVYDKPQRKLAMMIVTGASPSLDGIPFLPVKFNLFAPHGEIFYLPYYHRDHGPVWVVLFEAKPGGAIDRFDGCTTGEQLVAVGRSVIRELIPWDAQWASHMELADRDGWLLGAVAPTVRDPVGRLPSGRAIMPLGDTAISLDPIAGQGANLGNKLARHIVTTIAAAPDAAFDAAWMTATFESFWDDHGAATVMFNNMFLEPLTPAGKLLLISQYGCDGTSDSPKQRIANAVWSNFVDPRQIVHAFFDRGAARKLVSELTGHSWRREFLGGALRVGADQLQRMFGSGPAHVGHVSSATQA
jgi:2-polyprenyl-6-methoxyphenol hydroxylase-like FAD-dependent oxidoreductase